MLINFLNFVENPTIPCNNLGIYICTIKKNGQIHEGVIQKCELRTIQPVFTCTSHSEIKIYGEKYTVL